MLLAIDSAPWFAAWNYELLRFLFRIWPHSGLRVSIAYMFIRNPLASTLIYAAVFYLAWRKKDDQTLLHRSRLVGIACACLLAVLATGLIRPWIAWPAPARSLQFQNLYPSYLWGTGTANSFPSHSTLVYLTVAIGFLGLNRRLGAPLILFTFLAVSLPRIYVGGHYPIDVAGSAILSVVTYLVVHVCSAKPRIAGALEWVASRGWMSELFLLLWICELGEGFPASERTARLVYRIAQYFFIKS
jgi:undecaprenyl-diphosphatase